MQQAKSTISTRYDSSIVVCVCRKPERCISHTPTRRYSPASPCAQISKITCQDPQGNTPGTFPLLLGCATLARRFTRVRAPKS